MRQQMAREYFSTTRLWTWGVASDFCLGVATNTASPRCLSKLHTVKLETFSDFQNTMLSTQRSPSRRPTGAWRATCSSRSSSRNRLQANVGNTHALESDIDAPTTIDNGGVLFKRRGVTSVPTTRQPPPRRTTTPQHKGARLPPRAPRSPVGWTSSSYVCPVKLLEATAKTRNTSPFDPKKYFPLLPPQLPHMKGRVTLALDLDETLVHSTVVPIVRTSSGRRQFPFASATPEDEALLLRKLESCSDLVLTLGEGTDREEMVFVQFRPHAQAFLTFASEHFEVIIFTASRSCYADPVMEALMPSSTRRDDETQPLASGVRVASQKPLSSPASPSSPSSQQKLRLYREHCADVGGAKVKDMSLLGRALEKVVLIDNLASSFLFQPRNGVLIKSWYGESGDTELLMLLDLLRDLATAPDVVHVLDVYNSTVVGFKP